MKRKYLTEKQPSFKYGGKVSYQPDLMYFDACSIFKLNDEGFIYEHKIERILRNDMLERGYVNPLLASLMRRYGTAYPVPVAGFTEQTVSHRDWKMYPHLPPTIISYQTRGPEYFTFGG